MDSFEGSATLPLTKQPTHIEPAALQDISAELAKTAAAFDRSAAFPHENFALLHRHGVIGLPAVRELAGRPLRLAEARRIIARVARGEPSTAADPADDLSVRVSDGAEPELAGLGAPARVQDIYVAGATGARHTRARRPAGDRGAPGAGWLSGHKLYSSGMPALGWLGVWGRTDDQAPLVGTFLVPGGAAGIRVVETWDQLGMRASGSLDVIFEDVFIPAENAVDIRPPAAWAAERAPDLMAWMSVLIGSLYDAVARNAREWLVGFARARAPSNLGAALSTLPRFQEAVGELDALLYSNAALLDRSTFAEPGSITGIESNFVKLAIRRSAGSTRWSGIIATLCPAGCTRRRKIRSWPRRATPPSIVLLLIHKEFADVRHGLCPAPRA